jgi:hypothetical protein
MENWRQRLARTLPASWHSRLKISPPPQTRCEYSRSNYLSVWFLVERTNQTSRTSFSQSQPPFELLLGDEDGSFTCHAEHHGSAVEIPLGPGRSLMGVPVAAWPRRAEHIDIQVFPRWGTGKPLAEFRVKNPARDERTAAWTASPWPVTVTNQELEFTLTSLWLGLGSDHGRKDHQPWVTKYAKDRTTRATFRVTRGGEVLTNWNAHHVRRIEDATGNWSDGNGFNSAIHNGETFNQFGRPPLPAREAWRVTVEFSRRSGFETGEFHAVRGVAVPANGMGGTHLSEFGPNKLEVNWDQRNAGNSDTPGIMARVLPWKADYKLTLVRATDNLGRIVKHSNRGGGQSVTHQALVLEPDATHVDLLFAFHASRLVTFQVKPEFYRP